MKSVILMGSVWKFSKKSWKNFLEKWHETGTMPEINRYATRVCIDAPNITDWVVNDVDEALSSLV